jgi:DNA-binding NarL/FixJ family response regulator
MNFKNNDFKSLSIRELRIIQLAKEGFTNKEIALQLNIEESTVKCHRRNVMRKLGLKGKVAFLRFLLNAP